VQLLLQLPDALLQVLLHLRLALLDQFSPRFERSGVRGLFRRLAGAHGHGAGDRPLTGAEA
jgi:hypothetical protein